VGIVRGTAAALVASIVASSSVAAQQTGKQARDAYFSAVADFFGLPATEVSILAQWQLPSDEIAVALFIADRAGVSAEALVALRSSGKSWSELARRYHVDASHFYLPLPDDADAGVLRTAYERFRALPVSRWGEVSLSDGDIVALVNVRVLARTLHLTPAQVLRAAAPGRSFVDVFASLMHQGDGRLSPEG
jgi:hypothetical protein